jgi:hypothetical protein
MPHDHPRRLLPTRRVSAGLGVAAIAVATAIAGLPSGPTSAAPAAGTSSDRGSDRGAVPAAALLRAAPRSASAEAAPPADLIGEHRLVSLDASALPSAGDADGERLSLPPTSAGDSAATVVQVAEVDAGQGQTTWQGVVEGQPLSTFTLVQSGSAVRGNLVSPEGNFALTPAEDGRYWWTRMDPRGGRITEDDSISVDHADHADDAGHSAAGGAGLAGAAAPAAARAAKKGKAKVGVLFGFTKAAQAEVGGKANLKAAARLVVAETNQAFSNSGIKAKVKFRGLVKTKTKEAGNAFKNAQWLYNPRDGKFDNLQQARGRKGGDIIHLLTTGSALGTCGVGYTPSLPRSASRPAGTSTSFVSCLPYLVATHEIGHNFGADHNKYPGVTHNARTKGSFGFAYPPGGYISVMSYYEPCSDVGVNCVRIPWFSSPKNTFNGQPLGNSKKTNNTNVIKQLAPRVARYVR